MSWFHMMHIYCLKLLFCMHIFFFVTINWQRCDKVTSMLHEFILILYRFTLMHLGWVQHLLWELIWLLGFLDHLNESKQLNAAVLGADIHSYGSFSSMWEILLCWIFSCRVLFDLLKLSFNNGKMQFEGLQLIFLFKCSFNRVNEFITINSTLKWINFPVHTFVCIKLSIHYSGYIEGI